MRKLSLMATLVALMTSSLLAEKILIVAEEWAPYEFKQEGRIVGIDADVVETIMKKLGVEYEIKLYPWARAEAMVKKGSADFVLSTSRKAKRESFLVYPTVPMWKSEYVYLSSDKSGIKDLAGYAPALEKNYKIGVVRGYSYHKTFWDAYPNRDEKKLHKLLREAPTSEANIKKLMAGGVDLIPMDKTVGLYTAKLMGLTGKVLVASGPLFDKPYFMPMSKKAPNPKAAEIHAKFHEELAAMRGNGELQKIFDKWLK